MIHFLVNEVSVGDESIHTYIARKPNPSLPPSPPNVSLVINHTVCSGWGHRYSIYGGVMYVRAYVRTCDLSLLTRNPFLKHKLSDEVKYAPSVVELISLLGECAYICMHMCRGAN